MALTGPFCTKCHILITLHDRHDRWFNESITGRQMCDLTPDQCTGYPMAPKEAFGVPHETWLAFCLTAEPGDPLPEPVIVPDPPITDPTIHYVNGDSGYTYDYSQVTDGVHDGDVLVSVTPTEIQVAILIKAWPTLLLDNPADSEFHRLSTRWDTYDDGRYRASVEVARRVVDWLV